MTQQYEKQYNLYPIHSEETSFENLKRFTEFPTPQTVYDYVLMGIPKIFPITKEPIPLSLAQSALESAITEIEMEMGMNISPITHYHSEDYVDGLFTSNYMGISLQRWPATKIIQAQFKFPHSNTAQPYSKYTIPPSWIMLKKNRINVIASMGNIAVSVDNSSVISADGIFTYVNAFARGSYQPGAIEIVYQAGWENDKLPSNVADLIKTWAAYRMLPDIIPILAPNTSVSDTIDSVTQSSTNNLSQMLLLRVTALEKKKNELREAIIKNFGRTIKMTRIGS